MRRIVVTQNSTLDGIVDNTLSWFDLTADTQQGRELAATTAEQAAASDGFLIGRTTQRSCRPYSGADRWFRGQMILQSSASAHVCPCLSGRFRHQWGVCRFYFAG